MSRVTGFIRVRIGFVQVTMGYVRLCICTHVVGGCEYDLGACYIAFIIVLTCIEHDVLRIHIQCFMKPGETKTQPC